MLCKTLKPKAAIEHRLWRRRLHVQFHFTAFCIYYASIQTLLEVVSKLPLGPNLYVVPRRSILEILNIFTPIEDFKSPLVSANPETASFCPG